jgi:peptidoglycan/LPS O-acetylase OafA/YrhL
MAIRSDRDTHYLPTLDGWRGIAILIVLLSHDTLHRFGRFSTYWFQHNGRTGVDIFFALSGILICTRLLNEEARSGTIDLRRFYLRRFFRIQPAAWMYLLAVSVLMLAGILDHAFEGVFASLFLIRNYVPVLYAVKDWYTGHFWSLAVEEHFYLILPAFLLLVRKRRVLGLLGLTSFFLIWQVVLRRYPTLQFGWTPEDHTEAAVTGILFAATFAVAMRSPAVQAWCERWLMPYIAVSASLLLLMFHRHGRLFSDLLPLISYPFALISTVLHPKAILGRILEWKPLRALGLISYSLYLWQMLFFTSTHQASFIPAAHSAVLVAIHNSTLLRYGAALVCGTASYFWIERPLIRFGRRFVLRPQAIHLTDAIENFQEAEHDSLPSAAV